MISCIGISGKAGSGKSTVAEYIHSIIPNSEIIAFADSIKKIAMDVFGFSYDQCYNQEYKNVMDKFWDITPRKFMQLIGTEMFRNCFRMDVWTKLMETHLTDGKIIIVPDIRFKNELDWIQEHNGLMINVIRDFKSNLSEEEQKHESEQSLYNEYLEHYKEYKKPYRFDSVWHINNYSSKECLFEQVKQVIGNYNELA